MVVAPGRRSLIAIVRLARAAEKRGGDPMDRAVAGIPREGRRSTEGEPLQNEQTGDYAREERAR